MGNYDRFQIERNALKGERDAAVIELDFAEKHCTQACGQVDCLLKSKDQMGNITLKHALTEKTHEHANHDKVEHAYL